MTNRLRAQRIVFPDLLFPSEQDGNLDMGFIITIRGLVGGDPHDETARAAGAPVDSYLGTQLATPGAGADVFVPETDPALDSVETAGSSTPPNPAEIEREPDPGSRRGRE